MDSLSAERMLYHVSPARNLDAILSQGIDPSHSRGKQARSWWVERDRLEWALAHVSARTSTSVGGLWVFEAKIPVYLCMRTKFLFVFTLGVVVRADDYHNASHYLSLTF